MLDVLLYLFEHYFYDEPEILSDRESLQAGVIQAGFQPVAVAKAFDWLDALTAQRADYELEREDALPDSVRVYAEPEMERLDAECRGLLMFLRDNGVLDAIQHERVVERALALDQDEVDPDDLKWVVLMVLFGQPGQEAAYAWMESFMFQDEGEPVH